MQGIFSILNTLHELICLQDAGQRDVVWIAQAESYFTKGNYGLAAEYYGKTSKSFEEIALKFIDCDERDALKSYLMAKLKTLKQMVLSPSDSPNNVDCVIRTRPKRQCYASFHW